MKCMLFFWCIFEVIFKKKSKSKWDFTWFLFYLLSKKSRVVVCTQFKNKFKWFFLLITKFANQKWENFILSNVVFFLQFLVPMFSSVENGEIEEVLTPEPEPEPDPLYYSLQKYHIFTRRVSNSINLELWFID